MQQITKNADVLTKKNILNRISDIPGGVSIRLSTLVAASYVLEATPLTAPSSGKRTVCKQAVLLTGSTTTALKVTSLSHNFKVGDFVGNSVGGKAYAIASITVASPIDTLNLGTAIDSAVTGSIIYEMAAEASTTDATMNIAYANDTCSGLTDDPTSNEISAGPTSQKQEAVIVGSIDGAQQVETATIVGLIEAAGAGNATVTVTSADVAGTPLDTSVALANDDTASSCAGKIRNALRAVAAITAVFDVSGADEYVVLTRSTMAANDATVNIAYVDDTCTGLTADPTSDDTTEGSVSGAGNADLIITAVDLAGSPLTVSVALLDGDTANEVAEKMRIALQSTTAITDDFIVGGIGEKVNLTNKNVAAVSVLENDADVILKEAFIVPSTDQVIWLADAQLRADVAEDSIGSAYLATLDVKEVKY